MHKLNRSEAPSCLSKHIAKNHTWDKVYSSQKRKIWTRLEQMQGPRCGYCEIEIPRNGRKRDGHIEHFEQRAKVPHKTFDWHNLFGSCNRSDSCGTFKDKQTYLPQDLIKPDIEDPEKFLIFVSDGTVKAREGLSTADKHRADETIRIFHLGGSLVGEREPVVKPYIETAETLLELLELDDGVEQYTAALNKELAAIQGLPFETAIRHTLCKQN